MSTTIVTTQKFTKQELDMIVQALEIKFDIDNDTSTECLYDLKTKYSLQELFVEDIQQSIEQVNENVDNLLLLQQLLARMSQTQVDVEVG